jgi:hypothetical protein
MAVYLPGLELNDNDRSNVIAFGVVSGKAQATDDIGDYLDSADQALGSGDLYRADVFMNTALVILYTCMDAGLITGPEDLGQNRYDMVAKRKVIRAGM